MDENDFLESTYSCFAWHGTSEINANNIKQSGEWKESSPETKWLGKGVYFMENNKFWACSWAKNGKHKTDNPVVLKTFIEIKRKSFFDMTNDKWYKLFLSTRNNLIKRNIIKKDEINDGHVIDYICKIFDKSSSKYPIKAVKNIRCYKNNNFPSNFSNSQIQICVKDTNIIKIIKIEKC
ncbi:hypothetical protein [Geotoga petraea]|uniref:PARP catalytic domain-containing protein n=1 Tax=Geotoga petraea TaxID=28234 RepID=A0A4Z0W3L1_9BACT|nr:hypothetical protein [Geotoga petraea]TGG88042.1 hypothetical protein E4650_06780 [Geotoga petraea]